MAPPRALDRCAYQAGNSSTSSRPDIASVLLGMLSADRLNERGCVLDPDQSPQLIGQVCAAHTFNKDGHRSLNSRQFGSIQLGCTCTFDISMVKRGPFTKPAGHATNGADALNLYADAGAYAVFEIIRNNRVKIWRADCRFDNFRRPNVE